MAIWHRVLYFHLEFNVFFESSIHLPHFVKSFKGYCSCFLFGISNLLTTYKSLQSPSRNSSPFPMSRLISTFPRVASSVHIISLWYPFLGNPKVAQLFTSRHERDQKGQRRSFTNGDIRCAYPEPYQNFSLDYDPFADFFGMGLDMKTRKKVVSNQGAGESSDLEYKREVPCPVCRGRGYVIDSPKGPSVCTYCAGKCVVLEDSVRESAWETAQKWSPLKVEDDEAFDKVEPQVIKRSSRRVHRPHSEEARKKISRSLKELERRTGAISKRVKRQHQDPVMHAQMVAAIKTAKNTEASRRNISEKQKLFFQNPENRRLRGLQMKGVKFSCKHCGKEGHRQHCCPDLGYVKKVKKEQSNRCKQEGDQKAQCPNENSILADIVKPQERRYKEKAKRNKRDRYKCGICQQVGHNRRVCPEIQKEADI